MFSYQSSSADAIFAAAGSGLPTIYSCRAVHRIIMTTTVTTAAFAASQHPRCCAPRSRRPLLAAQKSVASPTGASCHDHRL